MEQHRELLMLAVELAALGEQVEKERNRLMALFDAGYSLSSSEILTANHQFSIVSNQFLAVEAQYKKCRAQIDLGRKQNSILP